MAAATRIVPTANSPLVAVAANEKRRTYSNSKRTYICRASTATSTSTSTTCSSLRSLSNLSRASIYYKPHHLAIGFLVLLYWSTSFSLLWKIGHSDGLLEDFTGEIRDSTSARETLETQASRGPWGKGTKRHHFWKGQNTTTNLLPFQPNNEKGQKNKCAATTVPVQHNEWGSRRFELLYRWEEIPGLSKQPTKDGRILRDLAAFDGRLHIGYGDYSKNSGPIAMFALDSATERWEDLGTIHTDQVQVFRQSTNALYTPEIDSHGKDRKDQNGVYRLACGGGGGGRSSSSSSSSSSRWTMMGSPIHDTAHNFDLAFLGSKILVTTGSRTNRPALLMASDDNGETWNEMFRFESPPNAYSRIMYVVANDKMIFLSGRTHKTKQGFAFVQYRNETILLSSSSSSSSSSSPSAFQPISNLHITKRTDSERPPFLLPILHQDELVVVSRSEEAPDGKYITSFRLLGTEFVEDPFAWPTFEVGAPTTFVCSTPDSDPNRLLVLVQEKKKRGRAGVFRADSLQRGSVWELALVLEALPEDDDGGDSFVSMALLNNHLYLGTKRGNLHVVRELYKPAVATLSSSSPDVTAV